MKVPGILLLFFCAGLLSACDGNLPDSFSDEPEKEEIVLKLSSNLKQYAVTRTSPLPQQTEVGVFVPEYQCATTTCDAAHSNVKFTADTSGGLSSENPMKLTEGGNYNVYAYSPFKKEAADAPEYIPYSHGDDVLGCPIPPAILKTNAHNCNVSLKFVHLTAQIQFIVRVSDESSLGSLNAMSVLRVEGFLPEARLNLTAGTLSVNGEPSEQSTVKAAANTDEAGKYQLVSSPVCFFVMPKDEQTLHLRVTHNGVTRTGTIRTSFQPGVSYTYTVRIDTESGLSTSVAITDWINRYESIDIN